MFLQLGDYKFEGIKLPLSWSGSFATNYTQIPIIDRKPVVQKTGEKLVEFDITAEFRDEFCNPANELESLQLSRRNGTVLQLTGGDGTNYGRYVITDISIVFAKADATGYVSVIQVSIKLLEYNTTSTITNQTGKAKKSASPTEETPISPIVSLPGTISNDVNDGILKTNEISIESKKSKINYAKVSRLAGEAVEKFNSANSKVEGTKKIVYRAINLKNTLTAANSALNSVKSAADVKDSSDLMNANKELESSVYNLKGAAAPVAAFVGSREGGN